MTNQTVKLIVNDEVIFEYVEGTESNKGLFYAIADHEKLNETTMGIINHKIKTFESTIVSAQVSLFDSMKQSLKQDIPLELLKIIYAERLSDLAAMAISTIMDEPLNQDQE